MKDETIKRAKEVGVLVRDNNLTMRQAAAIMGYSKTTIQLDLSVRLPRIDPVLYKEVSSVIAKNKEERHYRGGQVISLRYKELNKQKETNC